ncbi:MAG: alpha/beta fold hydrolase [Rhodobiaceae bacterium]|nr:alpha/beta fold hydrolase [Rhodobiaceae bacterium]
MNGKSEPPGPDSTTDWAELVSRIYAVPLDPSNYDALMAVWDDYLTARLPRINGSGISLDSEIEVDRQIQTHFRQALLLFEKLGRGQSGPDAPAPPDGPLPAVLLSSDGRVLGVNRAFRDQIGDAAPARLADMPLEPECLTSLRDGLPRVVASPDDVELLIRSETGFCGRPVSLCLYGYRDGGGDAYAVLQVVGIGWSRRIGTILAKTFGLTEAELEIARDIVNGEQARGIALARRRSFETVRTQIRSILQKTGAGSQTELVRLVAGLNLFVDRSSGGGKVAATGSDNPVRETSLAVPGDRTMTVAEIGPPNGRPVLFVHGMLDGYATTPAVVQALNRRGIRLIAPARPHFGSSPPDTRKMPPAPLRLVDDIAAILDHLDIERCPVIGHMAGAPYAYALATRLPGRVSQVISVAGGVPILSDRQFAVMGHRQRVVARTARYTPLLLPILLRAGIALLDAGGEEAFMAALYRDAPVDRAAATDPDIFAALTAGYHFSTAQGYRAFEIDSGVVTSDWSDLCANCRAPVTLVHGVHDPVVAIETVRAFASRNPDFTLIEDTDCGQLVFFQRPDLVLSSILA